MRRPALACLALGAAALLSACGSSAGLIPGSSATTMRTALVNVENDVENHDCAATREDLANAQIDFETLLGNVNERLTRQLDTGLDTLIADANRACANSGPGSGGQGTGPTTSSGPTGATGATSSSSSSTSSSTTSSTSTTTTTTTTSTSTTATTTTAATSGSTGSTCATTTGTGGGTPVCEGTTSPSGAIGGAASGSGGAGTGAASVGN